MTTIRTLTAVSAMGCLAMIACVSHEAVLGTDDGDGLGGIVPIAKIAAKNAEAAAEWLDHLKASAATGPGNLAGGAAANAVIAVAREGGVTVADPEGEPVAELNGIDVAVSVYGGVALATEAAGNRAMAFTSAGIFTTSGSIPDLAADEAVPEFSFMPAPFAVSGITSNTGNTTDGIPLNDDPTATAALFTQFEDRNILFVVPGSGELVVDPTLATAFYDNGQSVFGSDRPVSAFAGPNGFTPNDPMLAVTIPDDQSSNGHVVKLDLVGGKAVASELQELTGLPRRIRCIETGSYICAVSSVGVPPAGFGGVTFYTWDGQDGFDFIVQRLQPAIGIDLIRDGDQVLAASTQFSEGTYTIETLTTGGQLVSSEAFPVPEGCEGPAHILFRSTRDVVISCNTSGLVVGHVFDETS